MAEEVFGEVAEEVQVQARRGGDGAGVIDVVVRIAEPLEGKEEGAAAGSEFGAADDFAEKKAVGIDGQMVTAYEIICRWQQNSTMAAISLGSGAAH